MEIDVELEEEAGVEKTYDGNMYTLTSTQRQGVQHETRRVYESKMMEAENKQVKKHVVSVDMVNSPPHYNQTGIECIHAISAATGDGFKYYLQGNIMKYLWRFDYKDKPLEDLKKAQWYLDKLIEEVMADAS